MAKTQYYGTGRRKSSVARVRLVPGNGNITVNKKSLDDYLSQEIVKREVKRPFEIAGCEGKFDVIATVHGGGYTGQAGALRHGISRALCEADREAYRPALKAAGFLSRKQEEQASSRRDNLRTAEDNGNLEISGFLTDWIVMKIADFRFVTNMLLTNRCRCDYVIQRCIL